MLPRLYTECGKALKQILFHFWIGVYQAKQSQPFLGKDRYAFVKGIQRNLWKSKNATDIEATEVAAQQMVVFSELLPII